MMVPVAAEPTLVSDRSRAAVLAVLWEPEDRHRWVTIGAPVGLAIGVVLAIFGMPPIDLHTPIHRMGIMDPACGMTRGVAALLRGDPSTALRYNPASPLVVLAGLAGVGRGLVGRARHRWLAVRVRWSVPLVTVVGVLLLALEIRQQLHADLLMGP